MPIENAVYTLGSATATLVASNDNQAQSVHLKNMTKSSNEYIWLGGTSSVGTASGLELEPQEHIEIMIRPGDELWAISTPAGLKLGVLAVKKGD